MDKRIKNKKVRNIRGLWWLFEQLFPPSLHERPLWKSIQQDQLLGQLGFIVQEPENALNGIAAEQEGKNPCPRHLFIKKHVKQNPVVPHESFLKNRFFQERIT